MGGKKVLVVGSGPNGLAAAALLAREGFGVTVAERATKPGGGCRTDDLTLPGYLHDVCATAHPLGAASPVFASLDLAGAGLAWAHPEVVVAHPFEDGSEAALFRSMEETVHALGSDGGNWAELMAPFSERFPALVDAVLRPVGSLASPGLSARFGALGLRSALGLARSRFTTPRCRALFCGLAAHAKHPLSSSPSASFGLVLGAAAHAVGWPFAAGGSALIIAALEKRLVERGGRILTGACVNSAEDLRELLPDHDAVLFDVTPRQLLSIGGGCLPYGYRERLSAYRYGSGVCKVDWALSDPIPWKQPLCRKAGTVHLGPSAEAIAGAVEEAHEGRMPERPYVIVAQATLADPSRAPAGRHTAWAYCHVPAGSREDARVAVEREIERYAPGFRDTVLSARVVTAAGMEEYNPNYVGGDIGAGAQTLRQTLFRPFPGRNPYRLPARGWYACSAATPPGGGVHGLCGSFAAAQVLRDLGGS